MCAEWVTEGRLLVTPDASIRALSRLVTEAQAVQFAEPLARSARDALAEALRSRPDVELYVYGHHGIALDADLGFLAGFEHVQRLSLNVSGLAGVDGLERFRALRTLTLQGIAKRNLDVAALEHLSALERLALDRPVSGLEAIGRLEQLTEFESPATASALSNLRGHPSLRKLILTRGTHRDLTALEACPQLTDVELWQIKQLTATLALQRAGFLVASRLQVDSSYRLFAVALVISGVGIGLIGSTGTTAITGSLGRAKQGVASAVNDTTREVGSAIGIALMGSVYASTYTDRLPTSVQALPPAAKTAVQESAAAGLEVARRLDTDRGDALAHAVRAAFVDGLSTSLLVIAAIIGVASVLVILRAPQRAERGTRANRARRPGPVVVSSDTKRVTVNALRAGIERPLASGRHRPSCETTT